MALYCAQMSPDMNPVIDRHPLHNNIFIVAGFSGINITTCMCVASTITWYILCVCLNV